MYVHDLVARAIAQYKFKDFFYYMNLENFILNVLLDTKNL